MGKIKLIAVDMDGTLLNDKKEKPADFVPWVKAHPQICTVIASGRQYETLRRDFRELENDLYFLADNGSFVFYRGQMLHADGIEKHLLHELLRYLDTLQDVYPILCGAKSAYVRPSNEVVMENAEMYYQKLIVTENLDACIEEDLITKVACFYDKDYAGERASDFAALDPQMEAVVSGENWIDLLHKGTNKGSAIKRLQEKLNIRPEECMAFGDYLNDSAMLAACEESYAMANAHPDIIKLAKHLAPSNEEEGVMQILRKMDEGRQGKRPGITVWGA